MTGSQQIAAFASLVFLGYMLWPKVAGVAISVRNWWKARQSARSTTGTTAVLSNDADVTAEQAQASQLNLSRFIAKADKNDPTYKLIANGIITLAELVK